MKLDLKTGVFEDSQILINKETKDSLYAAKNKIDDLYRIRTSDRSRNMWVKYRNLLNKYETVGQDKGKMNRAYFKLKEMMLDDPKKFKNLKTVATLAEGPGAFIEFLTDFYKDIKVHAITLEYETDNESRNFELQKLQNKNVDITYGNLYNKEVVDSFTKKIGGKVDLVTADGGFQPLNENEKEREHLKLFLAETLTAFKILKKRGSFILKIYDIFSKSTLELLFLLSGTFDSVELNKPVTSRPANSERYVICHGFKGFDNDVHVTEGDEYYKSLLSMSESENNEFELYVKNLEIQNEKYVRYVIKNIEDVVNFYNVNLHSRKAHMDKEKERQFYKAVWEKEYEYEDRKRKRSKKRQDREEMKEGMRTDAPEFIM